MNNQEDKKVSTSQATATNSNKNIGQVVTSGNPDSKFKKPFKKVVKRTANRNEKKDEFEQRILDIARVTRVMAGGKRMSFRVCVAIGDKNGKVGVGLGKGSDVAIGVNKAVEKAKKNMVNIPMVDSTIPHEIKQKYGAAIILLKPAKQGRGVIAGGIVRIILELGGVKNITSKIIGTNNKINNAKCTIEALKNLKRVDASKIASKEEKGNDKIQAKTNSQPENKSVEKSK